MERSRKFHSTPMARPRSSVAAAYEGVNELTMAHQVPSFLRRGGRDHQEISRSHLLWERTGWLVKSRSHLLDFREALLFSRTYQPPRLRLQGTGPFSSWRSHPSLKRRGLCCSSCFQFIHTFYSHRPPLRTMIWFALVLLISWSG